MVCDTQSAVRGEWTPGSGCEAGDSRERRSPLRWPGARHFRTMGAPVRRRVETQLQRARGGPGTAHLRGRFLAERAPSRPPMTSPPTRPTRVPSAACRPQESGCSPAGTPTWSRYLAYSEPGPSIPARECTAADCLGPDAPLRRTSMSSDSRGCEGAEAAAEGRRVEPAPPNWPLSSMGGESLEKRIRVAVRARPRISEDKDYRGLVEGDCVWCEGPRRLRFAKCVAAHRPHRVSRHFSPISKD